MLDFKRAVKALCSEWDGEMTECATYSGEHYERWEIVNTIHFRPTLADCWALASYLGMRYHKGYFYKKI